MSEVANQFLLLKDLPKEQKDQFMATWFKMAVPKQTINVVAVIDNGLDTFDFSIPATVFSFIPNTTVKTISKSKEPIKTMEGITIIPDYTFDDDIEIDVLTFAAGSGPSAEVSNFINKVSNKVKYMFSVCQGSECLAASGILNDRKATVTKGFFSITAKTFPKVNWVRKARFVQDGNIVTTSGATAGLDGVFHLVKLIYGEQAARNLAKINEYKWSENPENDPFVDVEDEFPIPTKF